MPIENPSDQEIVEALEKLMSDSIDAGTSVILEGDTSRNYYIQFALQGDRIFCEAVSNKYLEPENQLTDDQLRMLENLGWREPEHEAQNWFRTFRPATPAEYEDILSVVRRAFDEVYGLGADAALVMTTSWEGQILAPETEIRFASEGHRSTYESVASFAAQLYGDSLNVDQRRPLLFIRHGSTIVTVAINSVEIHSSLVDIYALLVREVEQSPELLRWLLGANYQIRLGALALDQDGDVVLKHTLLGDTISQDELQLVLGAIVELADELDDEITDRFGGYTARDWPVR